MISSAALGGGDEGGRCGRWLRGACGRLARYVRSFGPTWARIAGGGAETAPQRPRCGSPGAPRASCARGHCGVRPRSLFPSQAQRRVAGRARATVAGPRHCAPGASVGSALLALVVAVAARRNRKRRPSTAWHVTSPVAGPRNEAGGWGGRLRGARGRLARCVRSFGPTWARIAGGGAASAPQRPRCGSPPAPRAACARGRLVGGGVRPGALRRLSCASALMSRPTMVRSRPLCMTVRANMAASPGGGSTTTATGEAPVRGAAEENGRRAGRPSHGQADARGQRRRAVEITVPPRSPARSRTAW